MIVDVVGITATRPAVMLMLPPSRRTLAPVFFTTSVDRLDGPEIETAAVPTEATIVCAAPGDTSRWSASEPTVMDVDVESW